MDDTVLIVNPIVAAVCLTLQGQQDSMVHHRLAGRHSFTIPGATAANILLLLLLLVGLR